MIYKISKANNLTDYVNQVKSTRYIKQYLQPMFDLFTLPKSQYLVKKGLIDCFLSPFAIRKKQAGIANDIEKMEAINMPISMPIYSFYTKDNHQIFISTTINTPEIDTNKLRKNQTSEHYLSTYQ